MLCGGTGSESAADENIQALVDRVAEDIKAHAGVEYPYLKAVSFKTQVVAGRNHFVKIDAGDEHIHARIFEGLPHMGSPVTLHSIQRSKSSHEPVEYF